MRITRSMSNALNRHISPPQKVVKKRKPTKSRTSTKKSATTVHVSTKNLKPSSPPPDLPTSFTDKYNDSFILALQKVLSIDPSLYNTAVNYSFTPFLRDSLKTPEAQSLHNHFTSLVSGIIAQQVSGSAARSIETKYRLSFIDSKELIDSSLSDIPAPTFEQVLAAPDQQLRSSGLSARKVEYVKGIADAFSKGLITKDLFINASIPEIEEKLCELKGIGKWSSDMFMLFSLGKLDVFTPTDLGVARGLSFYIKTSPEILEIAKQNLTITKSIEEEAMKIAISNGEKIKKIKKLSTVKVPKNSKRKWTPLDPYLTIEVAKLFSPYKSIFMMLMWGKSGGLDLAGLTA